MAPDPLGHILFCIRINTSAVKIRPSAFEWTTIQNELFHIFRFKQIKKKVGPKWC